MRPSIIIHGGAGSGKFGKDDLRYKGLLDAVNAGVAAMKSGSGLEGAVAAVRWMEDSGVFNAGRGACLTAQGKVELDAAVMTANGLRGAGVGSVTCTHNPVDLARWVMDNTESVLIVGERCADYAKVAHIKTERLEPSEQTLRKFERLRNDPAYGKAVSLVGELDSAGTVGAVAIGTDGIPAAAVSTGGRWMKLPGRVGDSAILGAGVFAQMRLGAACATGTGEEIIRCALSMRACEWMRGGSAQSAATKAVRFITKTRGQGTAGIITVDHRGRVGAARNTEAMGRAWFDHARQKAVCVV